MVESSFEGDYESLFNLYFVNTDSIVTNSITTQELTVDGYTFPTSDGTAGEVLTTNGAGIVSWQNPSLLLSYGSIYSGTPSSVISFISFSDILTNPSPGPNQNMTYGGNHMTANVAGVYFWTLTTTIASNTGIGLPLRISCVVNGSEVGIATQTLFGASAILTSGTPSGIVQLNAGDQIGIRAQSTGGGGSTSGIVYVYSYSIFQIG